MMITAVSFIVFHINWYNSRLHPMIRQFSFISNIIMSIWISDLNVSPTPLINSAGMSSLPVEFYNKKELSGQLYGFLPNTT
jgi:hypothetical protein